MWQRALSGSGGGGEDSKCILTNASGTAVYIDSDYVTQTGTKTVTFKKACKGFICYTRGPFTSSSVTITNIQAGSGYVVGVDSFEADNGDVMTFSDQGYASYGFGIFI